MKKTKKTRGGLPMMAPGGRNIVRQIEAVARAGRVGVQVELLEALRAALKELIGKIKRGDLA